MQTHDTKYTAKILEADDGTKAARIELDGRILGFVFYDSVSGEVGAGKLDQIEQDEALFGFASIEQAIVWLHAQHSNLH